MLDTWGNSAGRRCLSYPETTFVTHQNHVIPAQAGTQCYVQQERPRTAANQPENVEPPTSIRASRQRRFARNQSGSPPSRGRRHTVENGFSQGRSCMNDPAAPQPVVRYGEMNERVARPTHRASFGTHGSGRCRMTMTLEQ